MECTLQVKHEHYLNIDGAKVKIARVEKDWTILKLAEKSGVTRKTIGEIERGNKKRIRLILLLYITFPKSLREIRR
jgi:transcriptional regulator with XRE-family HTH domain